MTTYPEISHALYSALKSDPFYAKLEEACSDDGRATEAMLAYYDVSIQDGQEWGRIGLPDDGQFGASIWSVPLSVSDVEKRRSQKQNRLASALGSRGLAFFNDIEASMDRHLDTLALDAHWYLSILGVSPQLQGKGLGARLVEKVLNEADALRVPSYLTTFSPRNISFYERLGYENIGTFPEPVTDSAFSVLVRNSR